MIKKIYLDFCCELKFIIEEMVCIFKMDILFYCLVLFFKIDRKFLVINVFNIYLS